MSDFIFHSRPPSLLPRRNASVLTPQLVPFINIIRFICNPMRFLIVSIPAFRLDGCATVVETINFMYN